MAAGAGAGAAAGAGATDNQPNQTRSRASDVPRQKRRRTSPPQPQAMALPGVARFCQRSGYLKPEAIVPVDKETPAPLYAWPAQPTVELAALVQIQVVRECDLVVQAHAADDLAEDALATRDREAQRQHSVHNSRVYCSLTVE